MPSDESAPALVEPSTTQPTPAALSVLNFLVYRPSAALIARAMRASK